MEVDEPDLDAFESATRAQKAGVKKQNSKKGLEKNAHACIV